MSHTPASVVPDTSPTSSVRGVALGVALGIAPVAALAVALSLALAVAPAPGVAQSACGGFYTVGSGDTLARVAQRCGVTLPALVAANPGVLDDLDIEEGSRLRVPDPAGVQPTPVQVCGPVYAVRTGDTVAEIAAKCGLTIPLLIAANPPLPTPLGLHEGLGVRIPDVSRAAVEDPATVAAVRRLTSARSEIILGGDPAPGARPEPGPEPTPDPAPVPSEDLVRVEGVLEAGPTCVHVRTRDGEVFAITGELSNAFGPGDRVILMGLPADSEVCGISPTLELRILYRGGA